MPHIAPHAYFIISLVAQALTGITKPAVSTDVFSGPVAYHPTANAALCMDVAGGQATNLAGIQLARCTGNPAQSWTLTNGQLKAMGKCVDIPMGNTTNGILVQLYDCLDGDATQQWVWTGSQLKVAGQNKCLDIPNGNAADGQRLQVWDCSTATNHQMFTRTGATTSPTPVQQPTNTLSATDFGARGDGSSDNTSALQNAINAAVGQGKTLSIPAGTYNHSGRLVLNGARVTGSTTGATVLNATAQYGSAITLSGNGASLTYIVTTVNAANRSSQPQDCAILVSYASNATVANCSVQGAAANGIRVDRSSGTQVINNFVNGSNADGIALVNGTTNTLVSGCQVNNASDDSYSSDCYPGEPQSSGNTFAYCYAGPNYKQGRGFALMGSARETVRNCVSNGSLWHGIVAGTDPSSTTQAGYGFTIVNNLVYANASGLPVMITSDGGMSYSGAPGMAQVSGTQTSGNPAAILGWTPRQNVASPSTFSSYTGGGPGSNNTPGNRQ